MKNGKIPIVVPRQYKFKEHVNNHQLEFSRHVAKTMGNIILVEDIEQLGKTILNYDAIILNKQKSVNSNNQKFNEKFEKLVDKLFEK